MKIIIAFITLLISLSFCQWPTEPTTTLNIDETAHHPQLCSDGMNGIYTSFTSTAYGYIHQVAVSHLDRFGNILWQIPISNNAVMGDIIRPMIISDSFNGAYVCYKEYTPVDTIAFEIIYSKSIKAQHIDTNGNQLWANNGVYIGNQGSYHGNYRISGDGEGGLYVLFTRFIDSSYDSSNVYLQHLSPDGEHLLAPSGVQIQSNGFAGNLGLTNVGSLITYSRKILEDELSNQIGVFNRIDDNGGVFWESSINSINVKDLITDNEGGLIISGKKLLPNSSYYNLFYNRILSDGTLVFGENGLVYADSVHYSNAYPVINYSLFSNQLSFAWTGNIDGSDNILFKSFDLDGTPLFIDDYVIINNSPSSKQFLKSSSQNLYSIFYWADFRDSEYTLYSSAYDILGSAVWGNNEIQISNFGPTEYNSVEDGMGGGILVIGNYEQNGGIYSIQISSLGNLGQVLTIGDVNFDQFVNILDIVQYVNLILSGHVLSNSEQYYLDVNGDCELDVLDIVSIVSQIIDQ